MDASEFDTHEDYIAEVGESIPPSVPDEKLVQLLKACWTYGQDRTAKTLRDITGLSRAAFARKYRIPLRTVENWECFGTSSARKAPGYVVDLLAWAVINDIMADTLMIWNKMDWDNASGILKNHYYYMLTVKGFGTPMKGKWHHEMAPYWEIHTEGKTIVEYIWDHEKGDEKVIAWAEMPEIFKG